MSLYRRQGSTNWWIRLSVGGFKARVSTGTSDRSEAEEFEQLERERLWRLHKLGDKAAVLWQDVSARWLAETTKRSKNQDKIILRWLADYLDDEPVSAIDPEAIQKLRIYAGQDGMSRSTTDRYMALLRAILRKSELEWGTAAASPQNPHVWPECAETAHAVSHSCRVRSVNPSIAYQASQAGSTPGRLDRPAHALHAAADLGPN
jgi:hypothetical protein